MADAATPSSKYIANAKYLFKRGYCGAEGNFTAGCAYKLTEKQFALFSKSGDIKEVK